MIIPILYYLVLPFVFAWLVLSFLKKYAPHEPPEDLKRLYEQNPLEKRWYRAVKDVHGIKSLIGDFEKQEQAVEAAYRGKENSQAIGERAAFLVLNDKAEVLEEVDS